MTAAESGATLEVDYFDGRSTRAQRVTARISAGRLWLSGTALQRDLPLAEIEWPERTAGGTRMAHFPDGSGVQSADASAWDAWAQASGQGESLVVRAQQSWRWALLACSVLVVLGWGTYVWGLPWASRAVVAVLPHSLDQQIGDLSLRAIDSQWLQTSRLPSAQQAALQQAFDRAVARAYPDGSAPPYRLLFRKSSLGPNALALPGGTIVMTDELVRLLDGNEPVIVGVLAHELGHVRHRHATRMIVQVSVLTAATGAALGDFSSVIAAAPAVLGQLAYSRDLEREADDESIRVLRANQISPEVMLALFSKLQTHDRQGGRDARPDRLPIAFSSHPADAERIARFRQAAAQAR